tara:strand:- start:738 stop:869 length:132 start_codon:yes stop_codon:yes gene_type:complete
MYNIRPGFVLHLKFLPEIIGKKSIKNLKRGDKFDLKFIDETYK